MKRSEELLGLSVISIEDGKELGRVSDFIINPAEGSLEFLVVDNGLRYLGVKILPFNRVEGVGEDAVTVQNRSSISWRTSRKFINFLKKSDIRVKGTKILTTKGNLIGTVSEFLIDEESGGEIAGCILAPVEGKGKPGIIPSEDIITFGKDILVVNEGIENRILDELVDSHKQAAAAVAQD